MSRLDSIRTERVETGGRHSKPGNPPDAESSYRPISFLSITAKAFERILLPRIKTQIDKQNILPEEQIGFREKHGTNKQAHHLANHIAQALEESSLQFLSKLTKFTTF